MKIMKILLISGLAVTMLCTTAFATEVETELNDPNMVETTEIKNTFGNFWAKSAHAIHDFFKSHWRNLIFSERRINYGNKHLFQ